MANKATSLLNQLQLTGLSRLIPSRCAVCGRWPSRGICEPCYGLYQKLVPRCKHCAIELPVQNTLQVCGQCLHTPFTFDNAVAAVSYVEPWSVMIQQFKFYKHSEKAHSMALLLYQRIMQSGLPMPDLLIPIPNARNRMQERGYNQAWEITKKLGKRLNINTAPFALMRAAEASSQTQRKRNERFKALKNAFSLNAKYHATLKDKHIALIDDVMTTGATLESAAKTLKQAGVGQINVWVFARTPQERHQR